MSDGQAQGERRHPAHGHRRLLTKEAEQRLAELGRRLPPPSEEARREMARERAVRLTRRLIVGAVLVAVFLAAVGAAVQWIRPLPGPAFRPDAAGATRIAGVAPVMPWPSTGSAALSVEGVGSLGQAHDSRPVPIAGLAAVLTAYVVLKDHPLAPGADGPSIAVTPDVVTSDQTGAARGESELTVAPGETLTELDALEGLLIDSGNDMATLLADWDAGGTAAFLNKMNLTALALRLRSTHITDPSGIDPRTVSTASDLVRLGEAAMRIPVFRQIVSLGESNLPLAGLEYNLNFDLGQDGIIGIETGSDPAASGCYLFAAQKTVGGQTVTLFGAVLGQEGTSPNTAAVDAGDALVRAAFASIGAVQLAAPGQVVGTLEAPWGASTPVVATAAIDAVGWGDLEVRSSVRLHQLPSPLRAGSVIGVLSVNQGGHVSHFVLRTTERLSGPSAWWQLAR
jgi:serine-type D-Ala-D-Ala carboxypeptidase (penicillin-binding protein 5/6)